MLPNIFVIDHHSKIQSEFSNLLEKAVADLHSKILDARPPWGSKFFQFHADFWENLVKSYVGAAPGELEPQPLGNPGSATEKVKLTALLTGWYLYIFFFHLFKHTGYFCQQIQSMVNLEIHTTPTGYQVAPLAVKEHY